MNKAHLTHCDGVLSAPGDRERLVHLVDESGQLVEGGEDGDPRHALEHSRHGAPRAGHGGVAHVDIPANITRMLLGALRTVYLTLLRQREVHACTGGPRLSYSLAAVLNANEKS